MKCMCPKARDADLWILIWEELRGIIKKEHTSLEVKHVKAHRSRKEKHELTLFERFLTEANERADELAKYGAMLDGGQMAQIRTSTFH